MVKLGLINVYGQQLPSEYYSSVVLILYKVILGSAKVPI